MQVIIAECSAIYSGRGESTLPRGLRAIIIKRDGSVSIHNDVSNKPLNYMKTASKIVTSNEVGEEVWTFDARHESLSITLHETYGKLDEDLLDKENEPGLSGNSTESHLQKWLFENPEAIGKGFIPIEREFNTGAGSVDLLMLSPEGNPVAVEVKRVAMLGAIDQIRRYVESMLTLPSQFVILPDVRNPVELDFTKTQGMIAALDLRPKMLLQAEKKLIPTVLIPPTWRK